MNSLSGEDDMRIGEKPHVIGKPFRLRNPFRMFPHRIAGEFSKILASIPIGWGLQVPVEPAIINRLLSRMTRKGLVKRFEYVPRKVGPHRCVIYHLEDWLVGKPIRIQPPKRRRFPLRKDWDAVFNRVLAGEPVIVEGSIWSVYRAANYRVKLGKIPPRSLRYEKIVGNGKERVRVLRK